MSGSWDAMFDEVPNSLYYASIGKMVLDYVRREDPQVILTEINGIAAGALDRIYQIIQNQRLSDPECISMIESILIVYYEVLQLSSHRHLEYE